jgi:hypothetical protein
MSKEIKRMAKELDSMPKDVTSEEADLLEEVLECLGDGRRVKLEDAQKIRKMHEKYFAGREDGEGIMDAEEDPDADEVEE